MKIKLRNYRGSLVILAAIGVLAISLTFTVWRLLDVEEDSRADDSNSNLWEISQTQFEASVMAESLARAATGETFASPEQTPGFRLAILISRLSVVLEGEQKKLVVRSFRRPLRPTCPSAFMSSVLKMIITVSFMVKLRTPI
jgi:hypothetical protein